MDVPFKEMKIIKSLNSNLWSSGSFATTRKPIRFETCRERFAYSWGKKTKGFYFAHDKNFGKHIAAFILKTEEILQKKQKTGFALTTCSNVLWVEPTWFWRTCRMRRSLFTILLRAGRDYRIDEDNYEQALFSDGYLRTTRNAVKRFLFGYTDYVGEAPSGSSYIESSGWRHLMCERNVSHVKANLVSKRQKKVPPTILKDALWA